MDFATQWQITDKRRQHFRDFQAFARGEEYLYTFFLLPRGREKR